MQWSLANWYRTVTCNARTDKQAVDHRSKVAEISSKSSTYLYFMKFRPKQTKAHIDKRTTRQTDKRNWPTCQSKFSLHEISASNKRRWLHYLLADLWLFSILAVLYGIVCLLCLRSKWVKSHLKIKLNYIYFLKWWQHSYISNFTASFRVISVISKLIHPLTDLFDLPDP